MFEEANAWIALTEIFTDVLQDPNLDTTYILVDALDECITDLPKLLRFVAKQSCASCRVKWIVSSRNWPDMPSWDLREDEARSKNSFHVACPSKLLEGATPRVDRA